MTNSNRENLIPVPDQRPLAPEHGAALWDACIIGAGPAGSAAALHLARAGHRVLLLDREAFPREKVCGDALIADTQGALDRAGLLSEVRRRGHCLGLGKVFSPSRIEMDVPGDYITMRRVELDALMADAACGAGAVLCRADASGFESHGQFDEPVIIALKNEPYSLRARVLIVATGAAVKLLRPHGMVRDAEPHAMAVRCYVRSDAPAPDHLIVSYDRSIVPGYSWIFPMRGGWRNIGCGVRFRNTAHRRLNLKHMFGRFCDEFPAARALMAGAVEQTPLRAAPLRCGLRGVSPLGPGPVLAIGETIGATFPFSGEGIGKAMETGELAAHAIHDALRAGDTGLLAGFPDLLEQRLRHRYLGYVIAENWLARPWLNDLVAARARKSKYMSAALAGIINETADPRAVFSVRGILKSMFS